MTKARVAILISGAGSNMAALIYAARADSCPFEVVLVSGDNPDAPGLTLAQVLRRFWPRLRPLRFAPLCATRR